MPARFRVEFNGPAWARLQELALASRHTDRAGEISRATRQVMQLLEHAPHEQGDPMYRVRSMRLEVRHIIVSPLYFEYGVHETEPVVFIRSVASFRGAVDLDGPR